MRILVFALLLGISGALPAQEPSGLPRCEALPLVGNQATFQIDGLEKTRWRFGDQYPRPFFYPFNGPSGASLTRMGHPGAPNHDHHRSIWFGHQDVAGVNFWTDQTEARIRQESWYCYRDGDDETVMASALGWYDGKGKQLIEQELVAALIPMSSDEHALEIQITLLPAAPARSIELGKTNFGLLAVRIAKTISVHFGGGRICDSEGRQGEPEIFGKRARWMDYSGPVPAGTGPVRKAVVEGITYFDHPSNPRYPTWWHVRADGWMGAAFCLQEGYTLQAGAPLRLRYLLHAHRGPYDQARAEAVHKAFSGRPGFRVGKSTEPHLQYEVEREKSDSSLNGKRKTLPGNDS